MMIRIVIEVEALTAVEKCVIARLPSIDPPNDASIV